MLSLNMLKLTIGTLLLSLAATTLAEDGKWIPGSQGVGRFEELESFMSETTALLYLTDTCQVVALIVPESNDTANYLPLNRQISKRWHHRVRRLTQGVVNTCGTIAVDAMEFLAGTNTKTGGNANVCDPNKLLIDTELPDLNSDTCLIKTSVLHSVIALDEDFDPLVILRKELAQDSAAAYVPARYLGRKKFTATAPCTPTVPSPCAPPKSGKIKTINGTNVCVCTL
jgi:hypothetical protein